MTILEAIIVGIVQGLTEFIPVSSSAHIVLTQNLLGVKQPGITFEVVVHIGTLFSVFWIFGSDIIKLLKAVVDLPRTITKNETFESLKTKNDRNLIFMLILGTLVTGTIGVLFKDFFVSFYHNNTAIGIALLVTGFILWISQKLNPGYKKEGEIGILDAIIVGAFQSLAIFPGISRSGSTIAGALLRKMDKETAVRYSFLLSIPAILGATLLEVKEVLETGFDQSLALPYIFGLIFSAISGIIAIKWLVAFLKKGKLHYFSFYCWFIGILVLLLL
ncbi:Undecaprenyl-diphosphatase [Anaerobranca californiensis DSM 14826]|uniref:Undecaprenyl-diphosphatase n=1 Tax=Anaerobranca californiensis DSM 14826 TaxID=1120989 RepID=A0A1M6KCS4_9FIRM|nr:undecaprenyl-diphosphate phosphatase [Anaerobranca californiensis]SHJ56738.1 Undecaprenyl-diphosphatase [Anaerobranca californiensis DSM 14826]